jgi:hypothetical protein
MAATAGHRLTLDHMGKYSNAFFSETTNMIKAKLHMNVHWMVLYKLYVLTFMYSLALIIFVVSEKKAFEHFPIIGRSSTIFFFMPIGNPRWPAPQYID